MKFDFPYLSKLQSVPLLFIENVVVVGDLSLRGRSFEQSFGQSQSVGSLRW